MTARREAELLRLRANLEPHFVLSTLNTIAGLVEDEPVEARRLIGLLGDLFRDATRNREQDVPSIGEESRLERYAAIHEARHGRMIRFEWEIAREARHMTIPRLVLQPLVENAVLHGALRKRRGGLVRVRASVRRSGNGDLLVCDVEDDGPGFGTGPRRPGASGLRIVERSLTLGRTRGTLVASREGDMTRMRLTLPAIVLASVRDQA